MEKLPFDVLSEIFLHCMSCNRVLLLPPNKLHDIPWIFTEICSAWRSIALATPSLWSNLLVKPNRKGSIDMAKACISRTGSRYPLSLTNGYDYKDSQWYKTNIAVDFLKDLVIPYSDRLRTLCIEGTVRTCDPLFALPPPHSYDLLERLYIYVPDLLSGSWFWKINSTAFKSAIRLHKVSLKTNSLQIYLEQLQLPWSQLRELHMIDTYVSPIACHAALRECKNLRCCSLSVLPYEVVTVDDDQFITLPMLKRFKLGVGQDGDCCRFLQHLVLRWIKVVSSRKPLVGDVAYVFGHMSPPLEELGMSMGAGNNFESLLESLPFLRTLKSGSKNIMEMAIVERILQGDLLPRLELLKCRPVSCDAFLDAVEAWWIQKHSQVVSSQVFATLATIVVISTYREWGIEQDDRIRKLTSEGLNMRCKFVY